MIGRLAEAERTIAAACEQHNVGWTILRPTLIYAEGRDTNITPLSRLIRRFGFMPLVGGAPGLRQPVHAEDLAIGALAAASSRAAINKFYSLPGAETLTYREMIGRIFDGLGMPRRTIPVPPLLWRAGFFLAKPLYPGANVAMGIRMMKDMTFDSTPAIARLRLESESLQSRVRLKRFRAKPALGLAPGLLRGWVPVRVTETCQNRKLKPLRQSMNTTVLRPLRITRSSR